MNRVIRDASTSATPVFFGASATTFIDGELAAHVERLETEAFHRGHRDGVAAARADLGALPQRLEDGLRRALDDAERLRASVVTEALEAGLAIAEYVMGATPVSDLEALAGRIQEAIERLDDDQIVIGLSPGDAATISSHVRLPEHVTIDQDPTLQPGEARMRGTWSSIDMTRAAALEIARGVLS